MAYNRSGAFPDNETAPEHIVCSGAVLLCNIVRFTLYRRLEQAAHSVQKVKVKLSPRCRV